MLRISRRNLLASGIAASTAPLAGLSAWGQSAAPRGANAPASVAGTPSVAPREELLFDFGWKFTFGNGNDPAKDLGFSFGQAQFAKQGETKFAMVGFDDSGWRSLDLPHDWAVELPFVHDDAGTGDNQLSSHGYKPIGRRYPDTSIGWYRREFEIPASDRGRRIWVEFDGVYRDTLIFVNGCFLGRNDAGYVPFRFDLTDFLFFGGKNCITLRVDASYGDGWWYEGAGIYRHVWLTKTDAVHLGRWDSVVRSTVNGDSATLALSTVVQNESSQLANAKVNWKILDPSGNTVASAESPAQSIQAGDCSTYEATARLPKAALWSVDEPNLYSAIVSVESDGNVRDGERVTFGVRTVVFTGDKGFFLNGKPVKIQGMCNHHDHAGVGSAVPDSLHAYRARVLKGLGCNAVRTAHDMPGEEWVKTCDHMGLMMMCETRLASSSPEGMAQLRTMVKRYRNSPSIIIWSIGNEERQIEDGPMADQGARIAAAMVGLCHKLDPTRVVSAGVDRTNRHGISTALDIFGFNYFPENADSFHRDFPTRPVYGSETASVAVTRGEYSTDRLRNTMTSYDNGRQSAEFWWTFYATREWAAGAFVWTGFDYRGEPTPYGWPGISSQFGTVDTCGFPKDHAFYYKSWWGKDPVLHLFPHWNWVGREGAEIPVWVYSNLDEVELLVNGKSTGRQKVPRLGHVEWKTRFEPGAIEARGFKDGKLVLTAKRETTGDAASIRLTADRDEINADGEDVAVLKAEGLDSQGRLVPIARNMISFNVSGSGKLIGVGNGDPNCQESDKGSRRSLYNGLAQAIVQSTKTAGAIHIEARMQGAGFGVAPAKVVITAKPVEPRPSVKS